MDVLNWPRVTGTASPQEVLAIAITSVILPAMLLALSLLLHPGTPTEDFSGQWTRMLAIDAPLIMATTLTPPLIEKARLKQAIRKQTTLHQMATC